MGDDGIPDDEALLKHLRQLAREVCGVPTPAQVYDNGTYSSLTYRDRFGTWADTLKLAGVDKRSLLLHDLLRVRDESPPKKRLRLAILEEGWFSLEDYEDFFGTIEEAEAAAESEASLGSLSPETTNREVADPDDDEGLDEAPGTTPESEKQAPERSSATERTATKPPDEPAGDPDGDTTASPADQSKTDSASQTVQSVGEEDSREALLEVIRDLHRERGRIPMSTDLASPDVPYSTADFSRMFGTWDDALAAAGIDIKQELSDELQRIAESLGSIPTKYQVRKRGAYSPSTYARAFGSWDEATSQLTIDDTVPEQSEPPSQAEPGSGTQSSEAESTDTPGETSATLDEAIESVLDAGDSDGDDSAESALEGTSVPKSAVSGQWTDSIENDPEPGTSTEPSLGNEAAQSLVRNLEHWVANHPPEGDIKTQDVVRLWCALRDVGRTTTGKLKQTLYSEGDAAGTFADFVPYLQTVPGVERLTYGYWQYSGDSQTRNELAGKEIEPTPEFSDENDASEPSGAPGTKSTSSPTAVTAEDDDDAASEAFRNELIAALQRAAAKTGGWPSIKEFRELGFDVEPEDVWKEFGTWNKGKKAANLTPSDRWEALAGEPVEAYFDDIDSEEKAYWLGTLFAESSLGASEGGSRHLSVVHPVSSGHFTRGLAQAVNQGQHSVEQNSAEDESHYVRLTISDQQFIDTLVATGYPDVGEDPGGFPAVGSELRPAFVRGYLESGGYLPDDGWVIRVENLQRAETLQEWFEDFHLKRIQISEPTNSVSTRVIRVPNTYDISSLFEACWPELIDTKPSYLPYIEEVVNYLQSEYPYPESVPYLSDPDISIE